MLSYFGFKRKHPNNHSHGLVSTSRSHAPTVNAGQNQMKSTGCDLPFRPLSALHSLNAQTQLWSGGLRRLPMPELRTCAFLEEALKQGHLTRSISLLPGLP